MKVKEPKRLIDLNLLRPAFKKKIEILLQALQNLRHNPLIFETLRTKERQEWLYGIGRTHSKNRKPVTWTLRSKHLKGLAVDIVCKRYLWNNPKFYSALKREAKKLNLQTLSYEQCHIETK